jgi:dTDP-4-amino-4,6-dideoxygalactose transaminase
MADLVEEFWDTDAVEALFKAKPAAASEDFRRAFHSLFGGRGELLLTGSARQALGVLLRCVSQGSRKRRVLLSSFNCRVVRDAVLNAGLQFDTFDFARADGWMDWGRIGQSLSPDHLAVVVPHFFGVPTDFGDLLPAARSKGVIVIEDCAHTLGAYVSGTIAGQIGDAAIFSFNYDKPISLAGGGALLVNAPGIKMSRRLVNKEPPREIERRQFIQMAANLKYGRRRRAGVSLLARMGRKLHVAPYAAPRLPTGIGSLRAAVGLSQLERYDDIRKVRNLNAGMLCKSLGHLSWFVGENVKPAFLKLRIIVEPADAAVAVARCHDGGIIVANSNWPTLIDAQGDESFHVHARRAATCGLDVPVHQNLSSQDISLVAEAFRHCRPAIELAASHSAPRQTP